MTTEALMGSRRGRNPTSRLFVTAALAGVAAILQYNSAAFADTLYSEDFEAYADETIDPGNGKWSLITTPTVNDGDPADYIRVETVSSDKVIEAQDLNGSNQIFRTQNIDISGYTNLRFWVRMDEAGTMEGTDHIQVYFRTNSGPLILSTNVTDDFVPDNTEFTHTNATFGGTNLQIEVHVRNNAATENHRIEEVVVEGDPLLTISVSTPAQSVAFQTNSITVSGTSSNATGNIAWTNSLTGSNSVIAALANWMISDIPLAVGANPITVTATNDFGSAVDAVTITRHDPPPVLLNEIYINPPSGDDTREFVELVNTAGGATNVSGLTILVIDSIGAGIGGVNEVWDLNGLTGTNGLMLAGSGYETAPAGGPWSNIIDAATTVDAPPGMAAGNIGGNTDFTLMLVAGNRATTSDDLDTNDDYVLDSTPWTHVLDAVGMGDTYTSVVTVLEQGDSPGDAPDTVARGLGTMATNDPTVWYGGDISGSGASVTYSTAAGQSFHVSTSQTFEMTPGNANSAVPSSPPYLVITTPAQSVPLDSNTLSVLGVVTNALGSMSWTNAATSSNATFPAVTPWTIPGIDLSLGANVITVIASNFIGAATSSVTITREGAVPVLINEVCFNPVGTDDDSEFVELINTGGGVTNLSGVWLLFVDSDPAGGSGDILEKWDLSSFFTGNNGLLMLGDSYTTAPGGGPWSNSIASATSNGYPTSSSTMSGGDLLNYDVTLLLVAGFVDPGGADDVDTNDNLVIDTPFWSSILDGVGFRQTYTAEVALLPSSGSPDTVARFRGNTLATNSASWYGADFVTGGSDTSVTYKTTGSIFFNLPPDAVMTPGNPNINDDFAFTNFSQTGNSVQFTLGQGGNVLQYNIYSVDNDASLPFSLAASQNSPTNGTFVFTDTTVLSDASVTSRYYRIVEVDGAIVETNPVLGVVQKQNRGSNRWHMVAVPVQYGSPGENELNETLGGQLGSGLVGRGNFILSPQLWIYDYSAADFTNFYNANDGAWHVNGGGDPEADLHIEPGRGFWIKTQLADPGVSNTVFVGLSHAKSTDVSLVSNQWILFSWPFAERQFESEAPVGWGFNAGGGKSGTSYHTADRMFMQYAGVWYNLYLGPGGRWHQQNTTNVITSVALQHGRAYYYFAQGTSFVWRAVEAP